MNKALLCIARQKSFVVKELAEGLVPETVYAVTLNNMDSVPLRMTDPETPSISLVAGQTIRIYEWKHEVARERFRVQALTYAYAFTIQNADQEIELLRFDWKRSADPESRYPSGHLHVGAGLLASPTVIRAGSFHKAHIPTNRLSFESIVRFAIIELGVEPSHQRWARTLHASEAAFELHKTG